MCSSIDRLWQPLMCWACVMVVSALRAAAAAAASSGLIFVFNSYVHVELVVAVFAWVEKCKCENDAAKTAAAAARSTFFPAPPPPTISTPPQERGSAAEASLCCMMQHTSGIGSNENAATAFCSVIAESLLKKCVLHPNLHMLEMTIWIWILMDDSGNRELEFRMNIWQLSSRKNVLGRRRRILGRKILNAGDDYFGGGGNGRSSSGDSHFGLFWS